jgi:translation initiation factor 2 alpha subunit (eIF-2alpha)
MQRYKQEHAQRIGFKQILKEEFEEIEKKILEKFCNINEFLDKAKEDISLLGKYIPKNKVEQIEKLTSKKKKNVEVRYIINLQCLECDGVNRIKSLLGGISEDNLKITYISAGKFSLTLSIEDFKKGKAKMAEVIENLETQAKKEKCEISFKEIKK